MGRQGERGEPGRQGQAGDEGPQGQRGQRGAESAGIQYRRLVGYGLLVLGGLVAHLRAEQAIRHVERESEARQAENVATDRSFCIVANANRGDINRVKQQVRMVVDQALRPQPIPTDPALVDYVIERNKRIVTLREQLIAGLNGDLPLFSCEGIGNGRLDFSRQLGVTIPAPTPTTSTTGG